MPNASPAHYFSLPSLLFSDGALVDFFILPDLVSHCPYIPRNNKHCDAQARLSEEWFLEIAQHSEKKRIAFMGLKAGELTASCYPDANADRLRVCDDFMNYLFNLDDWLDEFDVNDTNGIRDCCLGAMRNPNEFQTDKKAGILTKWYVPDAFLSHTLSAHLCLFYFLSFFKRFLGYGAGSGCRDRFIHSMDLFFKAVARQSLDRANGVIPDLDTYIEVRRDTSGCKPCFQLIEFAGGFDLPDEVVQNREIQEMEEATNDLVTWSNVGLPLRSDSFGFVWRLLVLGYIFVQRRTSAS